MKGDLRALCLPEQWWCYILTVIAFGLIIRVIQALIKASERCGIPGDRCFLANFGLYVLGFGFGNPPSRSERGGGDDYLQPFLLGLIELFVYPILMASGLAPYIGAWLGFKIAPRLGSWGTARNVYQRFLIGNALVLFGSYLLMWLFIAKQ